MKMERTLIMAVTADKYELPLAVADTLAEMGQYLGLSESAVSHAISRANVTQKRKLGRCKIIRVDIDEEDDNG